MDAVDSGWTSWFPTGVLLVTVPPTAGLPAQRSPEPPLGSPSGSPPASLPASLPAPPPAAQQDTGTDPAPGRSWVVVDATGAQVAVWPTHRQAMADLGRIALRGADLPLLVHGPDGRATGDRLG